MLNGRDGDQSQLMPPTALCLQVPKRRHAVYAVRPVQKPCYLRVSILLHTRPNGFPAYFAPNQTEDGYFMFPLRKA